MPKELQDQTSFPFLELPAELRNRVYEFCLVDPDPISLISRFKNQHRQVIRKPCDYAHVLQDSYRNHRYRQTGPTARDWLVSHRQLHPALLAVNRQVHEEAVMYLYSQPIHVEDTTALWTFLSTIGSNRRRIREIHIHGYGVGRGTHRAMNHVALTTLAECRSLQHVFFDCWIGGRRSWEQEPAWHARQLYRDGHLWIETMGAEKAARVIKLRESRHEHDHVPELSDNSKEMIKQATVIFSAELEILVMKGLAR